MSEQPFCKPLGFAALLGLIAMALSTSSCAQSEASRLDDQPDAVMQAIRDYGRGHQSLLTQANPAKPDQTDISYSAHVRSLLFQEDFPQLEKTAKQNRVEKGRLIGGMWKGVGFYNGTGWPVAEGSPKESDWQRSIAMLKKWIAANPNSTAARLSLAYLYVNYSWAARGGGFADSISDAQWKLFYERNAQAKALLLEATLFTDKDPFWYELMQLVARNEGWSQSVARKLFDEAVAFEPGYYHYYIDYSRYLEPQWYGKPGDIQTFADETAKRVPEPDSSMLYFWIFSNRACYCQDAQEELPHASYEKLRQGYANIARLYGVSNLNANRFAFMSTSFRDQAAAREAFANITKMDDSIWTYQSVFDNSRAWATSSGNSTPSEFVTSTP
jgi:Domain of unknown function (DUF4034)